jgi:hypothetical protein
LCSLCNSSVAAPGPPKSGASLRPP